jgi:hypothetical protein
MNYPDGGLPIIIFNNQKYIRRTVLRRIRSHAMHAVQHRKYLERTSIRDPPAKVNQSPRGMAHHGTLWDPSRRERMSRFQVASADTEELIRELEGKCQTFASQIALHSPSLYTSNLGGVDPFNAFPANIDSQILSLFVLCW